MTMLKSWPPDRREIEEAGITKPKRNAKRECVNIHSSSYVAQGAIQLYDRIHYY